MRKYRVYQGNTIFRGPRTVQDPDSAAPAATGCSDLRRRYNAWSVATERRIRSSTVTEMACDMTKIDERLLSIMECPVAHVPLVQAGNWLYSTDAATRQKYPIRDGIPIMLVDEAEVASEEEFKRVMVETGGASSSPAPTAKQEK